MFRDKFGLILIATVICCYAGKETYRLPTNTFPTTYSINLKPNIDDATLEGKVTIFFKVIETVSTIVLHAGRNLTLADVYLDFVDVTEFHQRNLDYETVYIYNTNETVIYPGEHVLKIHYTANIPEDDEELSGLRKVAYKKTDNTTSYVLASDSEATYSRWIFPCFDEPHFKTKYNIKIMVPNDTYVALSNTKLRAKYATKRGIMYDFKQLPPMNTYQVTFMVVDYPYRELIWNTSGRRIPIRIYSPYSLLKENAEVPEIARKALEYFENYTAIPYKLEKVDLIEFPRSTEATENWGIATFRTGYLSPSLGKHDIYEIRSTICHEISHFWFGNLVSNYWWNDIWIHEGFAEYMAYKAHDFLFGGKRMVNTLSRDMEDIYSEDWEHLFATSVVRQVTTIKDIEDHFDGATYIKGGAILRQLESVMGERKFRTAVRNFLNKFAYGAATSDDLISAFEKVDPDSDVRGYFMSWLFQKGHPLVNVKEHEGMLVVTQKNFVEKKNLPEAILRQKWIIPLTYFTDLDFKSRVVWFEEDMDELKIPMGNATWVKFNTMQEGPYQVNYSEELWKKLLDNFDELGAYEQYNLIREAYQLFRTAIISCDICLDLYARHDMTDLPITERVSNRFLIDIQYFLIDDKETLLQFAEFVFNKTFADIPYGEDKVKKQLEELSLEFEDTNNTSFDDDQSKCVYDWVKKNVVGSTWPSYKENLV